MDSIGAFDAKTRLSELLERASRGEVIQITRHGKPVARLVPAHGEDLEQVDHAIELLKRFHEGKPRVSRDELLDSIHADHRF